MACKHTNTKKVGDVKVCLRCGITVMPDGRFFFDKDIVKYISKKKKGGK